MPEPVRIRSKDRDAIIQSLAAGVVPRRGQQHIQVGRAGEVAALLSDIERIADGGSAVRFIIGEYGAGKTFFLQLVRSIALEKNLVTIHADLSPDHRLQASGGQARGLYAELMRNLSTRSNPEGGALTSVVERFVSSAMQEGRQREIDPEQVIRERLANLSEMVGGYDFAEVIAAYWRGHDSGNEELKRSAVRWLRAEFTTKTDARMALGVRTIIDDSNFYDQLKLLGRFVHLAGYHGLFVVLDEMVNLYKLANTQARLGNYEQILRIVNDCLQGSAEYLGFVMGGTPEFLMDTRRGLYSYEALQSRLAENQFAVNGLKDLSGPVIRLPNLSPEELYVLLTKLRLVQAGGDTTSFLLPDEALVAFMEFCSRRIGDAYFRTPRNSIKAFVQLLQVLTQNPTADWRELLGTVEVDIDFESLPTVSAGTTEHAVANGRTSAPDRQLPVVDDIQDDDDELASFRI
ncbi:MAG TPA: ATP-binding protein [Nitrolancea sp.]|nr:ATP-binding protein [Nitrolancea sp.]